MIHSHAYEADGQKVKDIRAFLSSMRKKSSTFAFSGLEEPKVKYMPTFRGPVRKAAKSMHNSLPKVATLRQLGGAGVRGGAPSVFYDKK